MNLVTAVKWYFRASPYLNRIVELSRMKLSTNVASQFLLLIVQAANQFGAAVPAKYQPFLTLMVGIAQLVIGFMAHFSNTDGTSQSVAKA